MTGEELYDMFQTRCPAIFWATWAAASPLLKDTMESVADELAERQAERVYEATEHAEIMGDV